MTRWSKRSGRRPGFQPSTDERTGTRGCGEVPATKGDKVQRVLRWCKVLHVYLPACGASAHPKRRRRRRGAARRGSREGNYSSWCIFIIHKFQTGILPSLTPSSKPHVVWVPSHATPIPSSDYPSPLPFPLLPILPSLSSSTSITRAPVPS